jgi:ribosomal-protein-alanine N-acetyltransferase
VNVRRATAEDRGTLHELYREFDTECTLPPYQDVSLEDELAEVDEAVESEIALLAEDEGGRPLGFALARRKRGTEGVLTDLYVRPEARRAGVASALVRAAVGALRERGVTHVTLWVDESNATARAVYRRWGFRERVLSLVAEIEPLEARLRASGPSYGSIHVQTDDLAAVERAIRQFVPRLPGGSRGSVVVPPRNGWTAVYDELCDREPALKRRLARELSDRTGAVVLSLGVEEGEVVRYDLFERGRVVDEYLSVPEFHGPRPPGEVVSLAANPTLLGRLTGADPSVIRSVARTGRSPAELPPASQLLADVASALGLVGGDHGYAEAAKLADGVRIAPG